MRDPLIMPSWVRKLCASLDPSRRPPQRVFPGYCCLGLIYKSRPVGLKHRLGVRPDGAQLIAGDRIRPRN